ncbi:putative disease resistance protein [Capsicum chacoense]
MAYAAVISLKRTLEQLVQRKPHWIKDETRKMVDFILDSLEYFHYFLECTSKRRHRCGKVEELEREIRTAVDEAEDMIELQIYKMKEPVKRKATKLFCQTLSELVEKIDTVRRNVVMGNDSDTNKVEGNEDLRADDSLPFHPSRYVGKLIPESIIVGLEDDLTKIIRRLKGPTSTREVIPILGMGGIGKTTLARKAYDDPEIRHRFDIRVWVTVSQEYQTRDMLLDVLRCISQLTREIEKESDDRLMDMIRKKLMNKRYLVVMDDIWSSDAWDLMTRTFPENNNRSRIILTSRLKDMSTHADPDSIPHEISLLNLDQSWKLLHDNLFGLQQVCPPELEYIGKQVSQKCGGLPLALLVVAGHLSKIARTTESWKDVAKSVNEVVTNESDICLGVLAMSYGYLPNRLRPCFLYMGVFPEDKEVDIKGLINLWDSEGFISEEVGRKCFEELVSRNLIMVRKRRSNGEAKTCSVHDLVRELILREAKKEKFLQVSRYPSANKVRVHLLSYYGNSMKEKFMKFSRTKNATNPSAKKLHVHRHSCHSYFYDLDCVESPYMRTMHFFHGFSRVSDLRSFKLLRVLAIFHFSFQKFPIEITKLVHLRYLQFNCHDELHSSVSELYNLQTFIFCHRRYLHDKPQTIPATIWRMKHLRLLHVTGDDLHPSYFSFPIPSREVIISGFKLEHLEALSCICLSSCTSELFSAIPNLKKLKIHEEDLTIYEGEKMSQRLNSLSCLKQLDTLKFRCKRIYIPRIPSKYIWPTSLKRLTLQYTYLPWEDMENIRMLPNLEVLKIKENGFDGDVWRLNDEENFNQLKFLHMESIVLKHWEVCSVNFPNLEGLVLERCYRLEEVPKDFGEIYTLESIELHECSISAANSVLQIQEEQESMGNDCLSVIIDNCR